MPPAAGASVNSTTPMDWGFKSCLIGPMGTGKTHSLTTLLDPIVEQILGYKLEIFAIFTEISPLSVLREWLPRIHWAYRPPATADWNTMISIAKNIGSLSNQQLQGLGKGNPGAYNQFIDVIQLCNNFTDNEGKTYGDLAKLDTNCVVWLDSLTGINKMAKKLVAGQRPILTQPDWGVGMEFLQGFIDALTQQLRCHFNMCAHVEYGEDAVTGPTQMKMLVSTLGKKLAPVLPTTFTDVILTSKNETTFTWSTNHSMADLRNTFLPIKSGLPPSFIPMLENWKKRTGR